MAALNKEQVKFAFKSLATGTAAALQAHQIHATFANELKEKSLTLVEKLDSSKIDLTVAIHELNKLIGQFNALLAEKGEGRYPPFVAVPEFVQVKNTIVSFEFFLSQKLGARQIPLDKEEVIFQECIELWKNVGLQLSPREGMMYLSRLIQKANDTVSQEKFPLPDDTQY